MKVFYSWQSDLNSSFNRYLIKDSIQKAIKKINRDLELNLVLDRDTKNSSGSINIADEIFRKVSESNIFICDVSLINQKWYSKILKQRLSPNPNVLIELGYAVHCIGWERIICVFNSDYGTLESLPFDIRQNRITVYSLSQKAKKAEQKKKLTDTLTAAIKTIIENYDDILERFDKDKISKHDNNIFSQIDDVLSEPFLQDTFNTLNRAHHINDFHKKKWGIIFQFYKFEKNKFISESLNDLFQKFLESLNELDWFLSKNFYPEERKIEYEAFEKASYYIEAGKAIPEEIQEKVDRETYYGLIRSPSGMYNVDPIEFYKSKQKLVDEIYLKTSKILTDYKSFRRELKKELKK